jgi:hypothetical protein
VEDGLGAKFLFGLLGGVVALVAGAALIFILIDAAWYRWGAMGSLLFFFGLLLVCAWIYDRRQKKQWAELDE